MKHLSRRGFTPTPIGWSVLEIGRETMWSPHGSIRAAMRRRQLVRGFTLVEVMIVVAIIALLAAISIPNVLRGRTTANESAAVGNVRANQAALEMFRSVNNTYPATWQAPMYTDADPDYGPAAFNLDLGVGGTVQGYTYVYAQTAAQTFTLLVTPQVLGTTGTRSFFTNQTGVIRHCRGTGTAAGMADDQTLDAAPAAC